MPKKQNKTNLIPKTNRPSIFSNKKYHEIENKLTIDVFLFFVYAILTCERHIRFDYTNKEAERGIRFIFGGKKLSSGVGSVSFPCFI